MKNIILALLISVNTYSQEKDLKVFLDAYKTIEFPESKNTIKKYSFNLDNYYTLNNYTSINGIKFKTDNPDVFGYKAIINCEVENKFGKMIQKRMLVISYFDKEERIWKVFSMRESIDTNEELQSIKSLIDKGDFYTDKEYVYKNLAYWYLMNGKLNNAKNTIKKSNHLASKNKNKSFKIKDIDILNSIL